MKIILILLLIPWSLFADTTILPSLPGGNMFTKLNSGQTVPAIVTYTTDGSGNLTPISSGGGGGGGVTPGHSLVALSRTVYSSTNVTTGSYVQLIASTSDTVNYVNIFDSSGQTLLLAVGGAGVEVNQLYIVPGGTGGVNLLIPSGSRVSVKAVSATANTGELDISFLK